MSLRECLRRSSVKGLIAFLFCAAALGGNEIGYVFYWFMR